jgi:hypothetical protein
MSFFESLKPNSTLKRRKGYAVSPHNHVENFVENIVGTNKHKYAKGKPLVKPVFKDEPQREATHQQAKAFLKTVSAKDRWAGRYARFAASRGLPRPKSEKAAQIAAYTDLFQRSRSGVRSVRMNFAGITDGMPTVHLFGHGDAGYMALASNINELSSPKDVVEFLAKLGLPKVANLKINSCYSAAGKQIDESSLEILRRFDEGTLMEKADVQNSFAAHVHRALTQYLGFGGTTDGYLMQTLTHPESNVRSREGGAPRHMAAHFQANDMVGRPHFHLRKKDVRVRFVS